MSRRRRTRGKGEIITTIIIRNKQKKKRTAKLKLKHANSRRVGLHPSCVSNVQTDSHAP